MTDNIMEPIVRHIEGSNRQDPVGFAASFSATTNNHGRQVGQDGIRRVAESIFAAFPDCHFEILGSVASGDTVMCEMTMTGTHLGTPELPVLGGMLVGVPPTGRQVTVHEMHLYRVKGGEIIEHRAVRDDLGMMQQLGLLPQPRRR